MDKKEILENLATAIIEGNKDMARETAQNALRAGINPLEAVDQGFLKEWKLSGHSLRVGIPFCRNY